MNTEKLIDDAVTAFTDRGIPAPSRDHLRIALNAFEASLTRCGCDACTIARSDHNGLTEHDRTAIARVLHEIVYAPGASYDRAVPGVQEHMLACAEKVAAALPWTVPTPEVEVTLDEVNTPNDEEREALLRDLYTLRSNTGGPVLRRIEIVDRAMAALGRSEVQEPPNDEFAPGECDGSGIVAQPIQPPQRPPVSAQRYLLGTVWMSGDGSAWEVEWDDQDKRHMWVLVSSADAT